LDRTIGTKDGLAEVVAGVSATGYSGGHAGDGPSHASSSRPYFAIDARRFPGSAFELMDCAVGAYGCHVGGRSKRKAREGPERANLVNMRKLPPDLPVDQAGPFNVVPHVPPTNWPT
jgi:hypothetical protein